ncbi:MAG: AAA family ATPase [Gemmatimonadetes bacterium]|nr:AAA family ATPase [Gemmatimonadota bacterium]
MDIKTFTALAPRLPADIAILMRGPTGVGKSHIAKQCADEIGLPFIDVRGSTMSEGDVGGYPDIDGMKETGVMTFCMPSWFVRSCREPVVLMLDELNRSLPGVQQSFFQLVLDRELGNDQDGVPYRLHPETRVYSAVNHGSEYDVNEMDPALLRRFWVVDLEPTVHDWIDWAGPADIDPVTIDFIRNHPEHLRVDPGKVEPGTICPTPASWHRLDESLRHMGLVPSELAGTGAEGIYALAGGFVGTEAAISYTEFIKRYERVISAENVLNGEINKKRATELPASEALGVLDKLVEHSKDNDWKKKEAKNVSRFALARGGEQLIYFWNAISKTQRLPNIQALHKEIGQKVVEVVRAARGLQS